MEAAPLCLSILTRSFSHRGLRCDRLDGLIEAVVARDAVEMPLHNLRHGVAVFAIELVKPIN